LIHRAIRVNIPAMKKLFAVIGKPIRHSLSPSLYNAAFEALGMDAVMVSLCPTIDSGQEAVSAAKALGVAGLAVTIPFKVGAARACGTLSPAASAVGAVNTVRFDADGPTGENTDVQGVAKTLEELSFDADGASCIVLGAGGAARAVVAALAERGAARIDIVARTTENGLMIVEDISSVYPGPYYSVITLGDAAIDRALGKANLLVNATPIGQAGNEDAFPLDIGKLSRRAVVFDLIYVPDPSPLVKAAADRGLRAISGKTMFLAQALAQFEYLTGQKAPEQIMAGALDLALAEAR
jgi:shikimate dehydrogenase